MEINNERLSAAAETGSEVELKALLLDPGYNPLFKDSRGMTPLIWAALNGHEACVQLLLPKSEALSASKSGLTALMCAAANGQANCVNILLPVSNALDKDRGGLTALMWAACGGNDACVRILLPVSDVLGKDNEGLTASALAKEKGYKSLAHFIDAYALAQSEQAAMNSPLYHGKPHRKSVPRV